MRHAKPHQENKFKSHVRLFKQVQQARRESRSSIISPTTTASYQHNSGAWSPPIAGTSGLKGIALPHEAAGEHDSGSIIKTRAILLTNEKHDSANNNESRSKQDEFTAPIHDPLRAVQYDHQHNNLLRNKSELFEKAHHQSQDISSRLVQQCSLPGNFRLANSKADEAARISYYYVRI
jgi:hypothetical protein